jgi:DNA-binding MarR family transcriptional regulator
MQKSRKPSLAKAGSGQRQILVGALLRMAYQVTRERQFKALIENGFGDLNQALLSVMVYPYPDRARPGDLAERSNMTKQAMNYLLGQLETLGYIERRAENGNIRRLVFLTRRGWQAVETIRAAVKEVEAEWAAVLGQKRFDELIEMLQQLSSIDAKTPNQRTLLRRGRAADVA